MSPGGDAGAAFGQFEDHSVIIVATLVCCSIEIAGAVHDDAADRLVAQGGAEIGDCCDGEKRSVFKAFNACHVQSQVCCFLIRRGSAGGRLPAFRERREDVPNGLMMGNYPMSRLQNEISQLAGDLDADHGGRAGGQVTQIDLVAADAGKEVASVVLEGDRVGRRG